MCSTRRARKIYIHIMRGAVVVVVLITLFTQKFWDVVAPASPPPFMAVVFRLAWSVGAYVCVRMCMYVGAVCDVSRSMLWHVSNFSGRCVYLLLWSLPARFESGLLVPEVRGMNEGRAPMCAANRSRDVQYRVFNFASLRFYISTATLLVSMVTRMLQK